MDIPASIGEQIADIKTLEINYRNLHNTADITNNKTITGANGGIIYDRTITIPYLSIISKYRHILNGIPNLIVKVKFDDQMARKYKYNPKRLSYDIYSTVELWFELLRINHCSSVTEFDLKNNQVNVYNVNKIKEILNEIMILEGII